MRTRITEMFGIELPIFAFSHCRDVVAGVSKAGGMGVLGCAYQTPEQLAQELRWIDEHVDGRPYGIDLLLPSGYERSAPPKLTRADIPRVQADYMRRFCDAAGLPPLPADEAEAMIDRELAKLHFTPEQAGELLDVALRHPVRLVVSALGAPSKELVERLHGLGIKVGSMVGKVEHALRQRAAGVDLIIAQGGEAGGHSGQIASMILWPQVVDAVAPLPVLAAGGIGRGRQMAAALTLGAEGIWCGSLWLSTRESELIPELKERFFAARAEDAVQSRSRTGKPVRMLRSKLTEAWEAPDAPTFLPMPLQTAAMIESRLRAERARAKDFLTYPVGQIVGDMHEERSCRQVIYDILTELVEAAERLNGLVGSAA
ncbi:MAG TPA: nitronate monooxygenase family protein [Candidatus Sulfotelmatobacter sp.]|nr:nitronate monooxygenase family protein [Candidatus Sulfotelmatobacter sp.]